MTVCIDNRSAGVAGLGDAPLREREQPIDPFITPVAFSNNSVAHVLPYRKLETADRDRESAAESGKRADIKLATVRLCPALARAAALAKEII
jgi:hypothetical protein